VAAAAVVDVTGSSLLFCVQQQRSHHMKKIASATAASLGLLITPLAQADVTSSIGADYSSGKYGTSESTDTWTIPLMLKYESGPAILKLTVPYVHTTGTVNRDIGTAVLTTRHTEEGLGDIVGSASYAVLEGKGGLGLDLGVKVKFATAEKSKTLLTTGENDYSLQAEAYQSFGATTGFATLGWTKKGDPNGIDFRNPWYADIGASYKVSDTLSAGAFYDFRGKLTDSGAHVSEMTLFVANKLSPNWKLQGYVVAGFSDASPDWGIGAILAYKY